MKRGDGRESFRVWVWAARQAGRSPVGPELLFSGFFLPQKYHQPRAFGVACSLYSPGGYLYCREPGPVQMMFLWVGDSRYMCVCGGGGGGGGRKGGTNSHECAARALTSQVPQNVVSAVLLSIATVARLLSSPNLLMSPRETYFLPRNAKDAPRGSHRRRCSSRGRSLSRRRAKGHFAVSSSAERSLQPYFPYAHIILRTRRFSTCRRPTALSYLKTHRDTEDSREGPAEDREDHASYGSGRN